MALRHSRTKDTRGHTQTDQFLDKKLKTMTLAEVFTKVLEYFQLSKLTYSAS